MNNKISDLDKSSECAIEKDITETDNDDDLDVSDTFISNFKSFDNLIYQKLKDNLLRDLKTNLVPLNDAKIQNIDTFDT